MEATTFLIMGDMSQHIWGQPVQLWEQALQTLI